MGDPATNRISHPEEKIALHQCMLFSADPKLPQDQDVRCIFKYLNGTYNNGIFMDPDPEKGIEFYVDADFIRR